MTTSPAPVAAQPAPAPASFWRFVGVLSVALALAAGSLRLVDTIPAWWSGEPRSVRAYGTVDELEREVRTRLLLPAFFPSTLEWPPSRILRAAGEGTPTLVALRDRTTGLDRVLLCQTIHGQAPIPARLLPPGTVLEEGSADVSGTRAVRRVVQVGRGDRWTELSWAQESRHIVLRVGPGTSETEMLRMARSLRRGRS